MTARDYPSSPEDRVSFTATGEATRANLEKIEELLGLVCADHNLASRPLDSPSAAIEVLPQRDGTSILAVTSNSIEQFMLTEGASQRQASRESDAIYGALRWHMRAGHQIMDGMRVIVIGGGDCDCSLTGAPGRGDYRDEFGGYAGFEPFSFIDFASLNEDALKAKVNRYDHFDHIGPKRVEVIKSLGRRLAMDLGVEVDGEVC